MCFDYIAAVYVTYHQTYIRVGFIHASKIVMHLQSVCEQHLQSKSLAVQCSM